MSTKQNGAEAAKMTEAELSKRLGRYQKLSVIGIWVGLIGVIGGTISYFVVDDAVTRAILTGADPLHVVDASGNPATIIPGGAIVDSATNFGLIRGGHVDACVLGALEADAEGSFGNWLIPGKKLTGMGGAMDLVNGSKTVILAMIHTQGDKPKIVEKCTLPLTGYKVVDMIVTELCVLKVTPEGLELAEYNPELGDRDIAIRIIQEKTAAKLHIASDLKPMRLPD